MPRKRVYTETEISDVLKRATELQRTQGFDDTSGLSLEELEQIAADVGIDPDFVKQAALELEEGEPDKTYHVLGGPTSIDLEWIVDGEMSETKWEETVGEIRRAFETAGKAEEVREVGRTREWMHRDQMGGRVHVTLSPAGNKTRIRIFYGMTEWAWVLHVPLLSVAIAPIALQYTLLDLGPLVETGIALFIVMAFYMMARLAFGTISRKQDRKARKLLARLDDLIAEPEATSPERADQIAAPAPETRRIDASLLSDDIVSENIPPARRREHEGRRRTR